MKTNTIKTNTVTVLLGERGEHKDYCDAANNHRVTVVRMDSGHVGLEFTALPPRDGYTHLPVQERTEVVTPYPFAGALPAYAVASGLKNNH